MKTLEEAVKVYNIKTTLYEKCCAVFYNKNVEYFELNLTHLFDKSYADHIHYLIVFYYLKLNENIIDDNISSKLEKIFGNDLLLKLADLPHWG